MIVKPIGNRIIGKKVEPEEVMKFGLVMPDTAKGDELVPYRIESVSSLIEESKQFKTGMFVLIPRASPTARMNDGDNQLDLFSTDYIVAKIVG
jgi:co-chaperonin GroES (HSP10)